jgi:hypothetical protein
MSPFTKEVHVWRQGTKASPATGGRKNLLCEHGFRFFPRFYKHLPDTMKQIPFSGNVSVFNNLINASCVEVGRAGRGPLVLTGRVPQNIEDWTAALHSMFGGFGSDARRVLQLKSACLPRMFTLAHFPAEARLRSALLPANSSKLPLPSVEASDTPCPRSPSSSWC